jgi:hypothetical protein
MALTLGIKLEVYFTPLRCFPLSIMRKKLCPLKRLHSPGTQALGLLTTADKNSLVALFRAALTERTAEFSCCYPETNSHHLSGNIWLYSSMR